MIRQDARDDTLFRAALLTAVAVHAVILFLPWTLRRPALPADPPRDPIVITPVRFDAPDIERPLPVATSVDRRIPLPSTVEVESLAEPVPERFEMPPDASAAFDGEPILAAATPPPLPAIVAEAHPGLVKPERLPGAAQPEFPAVARQVRTGGVVVLQAVVGIDGTVSGIRILRAPSPDLGFSEAAVRAVEQWTYRPGTVSGRPVAVRLTVVVNFNLVR